MPAPVVLFVYNRPEHTRQTVEALAHNMPAHESELWVFSDAPKNPETAGKVAEVRKYIHSLPETGWFASVSIFEADQNKGLAKSIITGVTQVMQARGCAVVLEDDLITAPDFLDYMNACLRFYKDEKKIGSISGYSPLKKLPSDYNHSVYLLNRNCSHGWATWQDRWQRVDWEAKDFDQFKKEYHARRQFDQCGSDRYDRLRRQLETDINSWSILFGYWQFRQGMKTVYPNVSRIRNIGFDGSGVHGEAGTNRFDVQLPEEPIPFDLSTPAPNQRIIRQVKKIYSGSYLSQLSRFLRNNGFGPVDAALRKILW